MSDTQHTPGPWIVAPTNGMSRIWAADGTSIATAYRREVGHDREMLANADLIASAPELLEALKLAVRYLEHPDVAAVTKDMARPGSSVVELARSVIAKATAT